jgi:SPX domain protein involved in polyphosphate accumulation
MSVAAHYEVQLDRHEAKYLIPASLAPRIREFIHPFCEPDPYTRGDPPQYVVTTLQLDTPDFALHRAKANEAVDRFKLRARTYGEPGESAVYLEIKRKFHGTIMKSRAKVPFDAWNESLIRSVRQNVRLKSRSEETGLVEFIRLVRETGARPVLLVRYRRESYFGRADPYARVTFDRELAYQPTDAWDGWGRGGRWRAMDLPIAQNRHHAFSGVILEIKTLSEAPHWMMDLVMHFDLERIGICKYACAVWQESVFDDRTYAPYTAEDLLSP